MVIEEFEESSPDASQIDNRTDEEKGLTHGYEGNFKVGDRVRVIKQNLRIWSVKPYMQDGFLCDGFTGKVHSLVLYGRKKRALCSAITPIKVEFEPNGEGIPPGMFERNFFLHFD